MFKWKKIGLIFNPTEYKNDQWLNEFAQAPSVIEFDEFIRVYFSCRPTPNDQGQYVSYSSYVDLNKNDFSVVEVGKNPILELGKLGTFDEFGTYPASVIKTDNKYMVFYGGWTRCESVPFNVAIGCGVSEDGKVFEHFYDLSKWLYKRSESTYKISLDRMAEFLFEYMSVKHDEELVANMILQDVMGVGGRKIPPFLKKIIPLNYDFAQKEVSKANKRQQLRSE